jgi:hypothetical protein
VSLSVLLLCLPNVFFGKIKNFTADQVMISLEGQIQNNSKLYVTPSKIRIDGLKAQQKKDVSVIYLTDKKRQITLNRNKKVYSDSTIDEEQLKQYMDVTQTAENVKTIGQ